MTDATGISGADVSIVKCTKSFIKRRGGTAPAKEYVQLYIDQDKKNTEGVELVTNNVAEKIFNNISAGKRVALLTIGSNEQPKLQGVYSSENPPETSTFQTTI